LHTMSLLSNIIGGLKRAFEPPAVIGLDVPYSSKEEAKRLGAKWDAQRGVWFVLGNQNLAPFEKWIPGSPAYRRIDAPATPAQKAVLGRLAAADVTATSLAGDPITAILTTAPGNGAAIGGLKVTTAEAWFAARQSDQGGQ